MITTWVNEKGGVGKSSGCFNVGWYLAELGKEVLKIDLDGQRANLSFFCGISNREDLQTMKDVLVDGVDINDVIINVKEKIDIIPGNVGLIEVGKDIKVHTMKKALDSIKKKYDYIFIDVSPTPTRIQVLAMGASDNLIIPMLADVATLEANKGIFETYFFIKNQGINPDLKVLGIFFNKYFGRTNLSQEVTNIVEQMMEDLETTVFNTRIRNNISLSENIGVHKGITEYAPKSNGAIDIIALTSEILARTV